MGKQATSLKNKERMSEDFSSSEQDEHPFTNSVSSETKKQALKPSRKISKKKKARVLQMSFEKLAKEGTEQSIVPVPMSCKQHIGQRIDFLCKNRCCLMELCAFCILSHKEHINDISPIKDLVNEQLDQLGKIDFDEVRRRICDNQSRQLSEFNSLLDRLKIVLNNKINSFKDKLVTTDERIFNQLDDDRAFRKSFRSSMGQLKKTSVSRIKFTADGLRILKRCLQISDRNQTSGFVIDQKLILEQLDKVISNNVTFTVDGRSLNSTELGVKKYLHWFEWEKRDLHLFNIIDYSYHSIKLVSQFKIPPFSRSIMIPNGDIYLIGGEDPDSGAKKEVFSISIATIDSDNFLHPKTSMPNKKFDFALCYLKNFIYLICGKDAESTVVDTCERFDVARNQWSSIASINKRRYAASAVSVRESNKIFLFGGRSDYNNIMMEEIEEYSVEQNVWTIVKFKWKNEWIPVEVCSSVQVKSNQILIFGGSDASIEDSHKSYLFDTDTYSIVKTADLKKAHVFVAAPFVHGNYVFAVGNEYYVKGRNIHRFNIEKAEWDIVF